MPTYSYACTECEHRFDAQQAFSDDALTECPACAGRLRKLFGNVGVVFKGSGFYRNDARKDAGKRSGSGGSGSSGSGSGDASTGSGGSTTKEPAASTAASAPSTSASSASSSGGASTSGSTASKGATSAS